MTHDRTASSADEADHALEELMAGVLRARAEDLPSPATDLTEGGVARGYRLRRRRRVRVTVVSLAVVVATAGAPLGVLRLVEDRSARTAPAVPAPPDRPAGVASAPPVGAEEMLAKLRSLLPPGWTLTEPRGRGTVPPADEPAPGTPFASGVVLDDRGGSSGVSVALSGPGTVPGADSALCPPVQVRPYDQCRSTRQRDGSTLVVNRSHVYPNRPTGQREWSVMMRHPDGSSVTASALGGGGEKTTDDDVDPLLSTDRLTEMATSPVWDPVLAALRVRGEPAAPPVMTVLWPLERMTATLKDLLPPGVTSGDWYGGDGHVSGILDDGRGRSEVRLQIQTGMGSVAAYMDCGRRGRVDACAAETLPGDVKVLRFERPSEKGGAATVRTVEILRPDGVRIIASSLDAASEAGAVTRPEPLLTPDQLQAMATDRRWPAP